MMRYHILNGDSLAAEFPRDDITGQVVVIREAFIDGPVSIDFSKKYWDTRMAFITSAHGASREEYEIQFLSQLLLLDAIMPEDEVCLWFEDDLFCQANLWFSVFYISSMIKPKFFRIFPREDNFNWSGFGKADKNELKNCFASRQAFTDADILFSNKLWAAYVEDNREELKLLSGKTSECFRHLNEVVKAHLDRTQKEDLPGRPQQALIDILNEGKTNFYEICDEFWKREAIYGFSDLQVYKMLEEMEIDFSDDLN